nr:uncharacterized protein CTRU02_15009 [Colletotrichum truncatum]KAF6781504.1 hypothetical protein CTRU02_15009 [Colletotrichum truncatum]
MLFSPPPHVELGEHREKGCGRRRLRRRKGLKPRSRVLPFHLLRRVRFSVMVPERFCCFQGRLTGIGVL